MTRASTPDVLYKIVSMASWERSQSTQVLELPPLDQDFIHLATEDQVARVVRKFWSGKEHVVLKLDSSALIGRLVYESNPGGETKYYHLYEGMIPWEALLGPR